MADVSTINAQDLLRGVQLQFMDKPGQHAAGDDDAPDVSQASPLNEVAASLKDAYQRGSWNLGDAGAAGLPYEVYTAALRGALLEWGGDPVTTLPTRLRAADALPNLLGMARNVHEALLLRALDANQQVVSEIQAQASAIRNHRYGLSKGDFVSKAAYAEWRARQLRAARAMLLSQQSLPPYNALLEVSVVGARELVPPKGSGGGLLCCVKPPEVSLSPYAWAGLLSSAKGAGQVLASLNIRTQRTQVLMDAGPNPSWQAKLQPLTLTREECELRFKVQQCNEPSGQPGGHRDDILGVIGVRLPGLQAGLTQRISLPLFVPPGAIHRSDAPPGGDDPASQVFHRVVYDPQTDAIEGEAGLRQEGYLIVLLRYIAERRQRCDVPSEGVFCELTDDSDEEVEERQSSQLGVARPSAGTRSRPSALRVPTRFGADATSAREDDGGVAPVTRPGTDYLALLAKALAQGLNANPLASAADMNRFIGRFSQVNVALAVQPLGSMPPPPQHLDPVTLLKQMAAALTAASRTGKLRAGPDAAAVAALPPLPNVPEEIRSSLLSSKSMRRRTGGGGRSNTAAGGRGPGRQQRVPRNPYDKATLEPPSYDEEESNAMQDVWRLVSDAMIAPFLPWGCALPLLLRAGSLMGVRAETLLLLIVQHMLEDWPLYISHTSITKRGQAKQPKMLPGQGNTMMEGGAQDYLGALRALWQPCLKWHAAGTLTVDEEVGVKGIMGLLLGRALPALENHYSVFVGEEGGVSLGLLIDIVGWAWTWNPKQKPPIDLFSDYLSETAVLRMAPDLKIGHENLPEAVETIIRSVHAASEDYHRDKDIQLLQPALAGFAAANAVARYEQLSDHLDTLFLYLPGNSKDAMAAMPQLEAALAEHHALLVAEGLATAIAPPVPPAHLVPKKGAPSSGLSHAGSLMDPMAELSELGFQDTATERMSRRSSAGGLATRRSAALRKTARNAPVIHLFDWESAYIDELARWVQLGVGELHSAIMRLVSSEDWAPVNSATCIANSAVEMTRLIDAPLSRWLGEACSGSEARRLKVGALITACIMHLVCEFMNAVIACWEQALDEAADRFKTGPTKPTVAKPSKLPAVPSENGSSAPSFLGSATGASNPWTAMLPSNLAASAPALDRVMSLALGMEPGLEGLPSIVPSAPPAAGHRHRHSHTRSTSSIPQLTAITKDAGAARAAVLTALEQQIGLAITPAMCVMRCTLRQVSQDALDLGQHLLQCLVLPSLLDGEAPGRGVRGSANRPQLRGSAASSTADSDSDTEASSVASRPSAASVRTSFQSNSNPYGRGQPEHQDGGWGRRSAGKPPGPAPEEAGWGRRRSGGNNGAAPGPGLPPIGRSSANGKTAGPTQPLPNFVGLYWQELARRAAAVTSACVSSYSMTMRTTLITCMMACCSTKPGEPVFKEILEGNKGLISALDTELHTMRTGFGGDVVLVVEAAGALWRSATSGLQLLGLNQGGFRPLAEEECDILVDLLKVLQELYHGELQRLAQEKRVTLDVDALPDPAYPKVLADRAARRPVRSFTAPNGAPNAPMPSELLASLRLPAPPVLPEDAPAVRVRSIEYCSALLQKVNAEPDELQDLYRVLEASLAGAELAPPIGLGPPPVYLQLGPQQLPLLDLLRLLRARRKTDPAAAAWADNEVKKSGAVMTQVVFGLLSSQRVVAEIKCSIVSSAGRTAGRLLVTQEALCFTTLIDADKTAVQDTTLSLLRGKVVRAAPGQEPGSIALTTLDHDILVFVGFQPANTRDRLLTILQTPPEPAGAPQAGRPPLPAAGKPGTTGKAAAGPPGNRPGSNAPAGQPVPGGAGQGHGAAAGLSAFAPPAAGAHHGHTSSVSSLPDGFRRPPSKNAWEERAAMIMPDDPLSFRPRLPDPEPPPPPPPPPPPVRPESPKKEAAAPAPARDANLSTVVVMNSPCAKLGTIRNTQGVLTLYADRLEFTDNTGAVLHRVFAGDVVRVTQQTSFLNGTALVISDQSGSEPLQLVGLSDVMLASLKQRILEDLT